MIQNISEDKFANRKVGEIVSDNYNAAGVLRNYGIDFCCGGGKLLAEVCSEKGLDLSEINRALEDLNNQPTHQGDDYKSWKPDFLIDYIINTHHLFVKEKTKEITAYAAKVAKVHGRSNPENVEINKKFSMLCAELMDHLNDEEKVVFPLIKTVLEKTEKNQEVTEEEKTALKRELRNMESDHDKAGRIMESIRKASNEFTPPEYACRTYQVLYQNLEGFEKDLHKHVHLENNILFQKAERLLEKAERQG